MDEENKEVDSLEVRDGRLETAQQAPRERDQPVAYPIADMKVHSAAKESNYSPTCVVYLARHAPPSACQQTSASLGLQVLQMRNLAQR